MWLATRWSHSAGERQATRRGRDKLLGQGQGIEEVCRHLGITESTWHCWKKQYGGIKADDAKRLKELEKEKTTLKSIVADRALNIDRLKEANRGN